MKTITLTDEEYIFLKEAKQLLATQDNRCTRDPFFVIMDWKDVPVPDGEGEKVKWHTHECDNPKCRGSILHQKLKLFDEMNGCLIDAYEELISIGRLQDWHSVEFRDKMIRMTEVLEKVNGKKIEEVLK